jgi:hypothetical protein
MKKQTFRGIMLEKIASLVPFRQIQKYRAVGALKLRIFQCGGRTKTGKLPASTGFVVICD